MPVTVIYNDNIQEIFTTIDDCIKSSNFNKAIYWLCENLDLTGLEILPSNIETLKMYDCTVYSLPLLPKKVGLIEITNCNIIKIQINSDIIIYISTSNSIHHSYYYNYCSNKLYRNDTKFPFHTNELVKYIKNRGYRDMIYCYKCLL